MTINIEAHEPPPLPTPPKTYTVTISDLTAEHLANFTAFLGCTQSLRPFGMQHSDYVALLRLLDQDKIERVSPRGSIRVVENFPLKTRTVTTRGDGW